MNAVRRSSGGFTMAEVLIATGLLVLSMTGAWSSYIAVSRWYNSGAAYLQASVRTSQAMDYMLVGTTRANWPGIREACATNATLATSASGWAFTSGSNVLCYSTWSRLITDAAGNVIARDVASSSASITNGALCIALAMADHSATYVSTNRLTMYVQMRN